MAHSDGMIERALTILGYAGNISLPRPLIHKNLSVRDERRCGIRSPVRKSQDSCCGCGSACHGLFARPGATPAGCDQFPCVWLAATAGLPFTLLWGLSGFGLFCFDVVAVIPLLIVASTRLIGIGLAVGFATTCGVIAYIVTHTNWNALFG
jgi:hypothetical protein